MLDVVTAKSAVFIDELGRGTEARHGTAMAGAVVEELDRSGARGIFATHLHGVLDLGLNLSPFAKRMMMETRDDRDGRLRPTLRMVLGECRESLALQTATDMGVSDEVVQRSQALLAQIPETVVVGKTSVCFSGESVASLDDPRRGPAARVLREPLSPSAPELGSVPEAGIVHVDDVPPPAARAWSCVYVLRRGDGWAYCGETDDLGGRLGAHRATAAREGRMKWSALSLQFQGRWRQEPRKSIGVEGDSKAESRGHSVTEWIRREKHELRVSGLGFPKPCALFCRREC